MIISTPMGKLKFEGLSFMQLLLLYTAFLMKHKKKKKKIIDRNYFRPWLPKYSNLSFNCKVTRNAKSQTSPKI